ncbi:hypothetical protein ACUTSW_14430 [Serratia sp. TSA_198.1]|uniref:hypothetical protein n=1 Tax=Serratia sp. TSA_198.1 TaxID=3415664 RepID=UPI004045DAD5
MSLEEITRPVLYSTMTYLAYNVNKRYYGGKHYLWCTPYFGVNIESPHFTVPPSSSPLEIYNSLKKDVDTSDIHSSKIQLNRMGIRQGASINLRLGLINKEQHDDIVEISKLSDINLFRPLLCVISRVEAIPYYKKVAIKERANPLSYEYILSDLPESVFDIIRIG